MTVLVISCSLHPASRSRVLARHAEQTLRAAGVDAALLDLADLDLPQCDGERALADPRVRAVADRIRAARAIVLAFPVYNYDAGATAKNLVELVGSAFADKVVGMLCAASANAAYMAPLGLAGSLMLDFRCLVLPRYVYATGELVGDGEHVASPEVRRRIEELVRRVVEVSAALSRPIPWAGSGPGAP